MGIVSSQIPVSFRKMFLTDGGIQRWNMLFYNQYPAAGGFQKELKNKYISSFVNGSDLSDIGLQ